MAEHYEADKTVAYHAEKIRQISNSLNWKRTKCGNIEALCDSAANQRTLNGQKSVAELFAENGISVNTCVNKSVYSGINKVKALLKPLNGNPKLFVFANCVNMIREFKGYLWGANDSPVKRDDHAMDELRYYCANLAERKQPVQKTWVQLDKERLSRKLRGYNL